MTLPVTEILCEWASRTTFEDIPLRTVQCAKEQVISIIAAIYAVAGPIFSNPSTGRSGNGETGRKPPSWGRGSKAA